MCVIIINKLIKKNNVCITQTFILKNLKFLFFWEKKVLHYKINFSKLNKSCFWTIKVCHLFITYKICLILEKSRVGVVTSGGEPVGFVFTDLNVNIKQLREIIEQQVSFIFYCSLYIPPPSWFEFPIPIFKNWCLEFYFSQVFFFLNVNSRV